MIDDLQNLIGRFAELKEQLADCIGSIQEELVNSVDLEEQADASFALRELSEICDDTRKTSVKAKKAIDRTACLVYTTLAANVDESDYKTARKRIKPISTEYCSATPHITLITTIPNRHKDPERWKQLMDGMGVPADLLGNEDDRPLLSLSYLGISEWITQRQADGKPLPAGIRKEDIYFDYVLKVRRKPGSTVFQSSSKSKEDNTA